MVRVRIEFDHPSLFAPGRRVVMRAGSEQHLETRIEEFRSQHGRWVAKLEGIDSIEAAESWIGGTIAIPGSEWPDAEPGSFFSFDLEGCRVYTEGEAIGTVKEVLDYGGTALLRLEENGEETLVPFARSFLKKVDTEGKRIDVELPEGLIGLNRT